jgi:PAS domain S-box-containing protein
MNNDRSESRNKELELDGNRERSSEIVSTTKKEMAFRLAIENALPSGIAVVDDTGKQVYVNKSFCDMFGWSEDELLGKKPPYLYWSESGMESINIALEKTLGNNAPKEGFDLLFCHKSGRLIPVNAIIAPFIQEDNKTFWVANVIDITERKKEEEALKKSQLLLRSSIENQQGTIIFAIDKNYKYLFFNKAHWEAMKFAYDTEADIGTNFLNCISKDEDRKLLKEIIDRSFLGESSSIIQTFGDANLAYYEVFFNPIINENDEIIGCTGLARNITERKQSDLALRESETKFKEIINQINDIIIVFDEQAKIIIWNKGAEQITGLKAGEAINRSIIDIQCQVTPPPVNDRLRIENVINGIITFKTPELFNQIIDSEMIPVNSRVIRNIQSTVFPIKFENYNLFCTVIRDVTEIKRYEQEILRISADKDKFYSVIAHYMYSPVNTFYNFTTVMAVEMDSLPIKELQKMAIMMSKSATNLYSLLDNLLQWTKMNQGKINFKPERLNFMKTSKDALSILKPNADMKNIKINHNVSEEITVFADIFMLKTILRNLVSNAIRFTTGTGQIDISAKQTSSDVTISVLDNGSGLSPDNLKKLFLSSEIHTALDTAEEKGTTLGLLLCKEFIEKHGGNIWVESSNGSDCEVKFTMPTYS